MLWPCEAAGVYGGSNAWKKRLFGCLPYPGFFPGDSDENLSHKQKILKALNGRGKEGGFAGEVRKTEPPSNAA